MSATAAVADSRRSMLLIMVLFAAFGLMWGVWAVVLADLNQALGLSAGALGLTLTLGTLASLPTMFFGGPLADRLGVRRVISVAALAMVMALTGIALVDGYALFVLLLMILFAGSGVYDVGINAAAAGYEQRTHRRVMTWFHAAFSGAAAAGALLAGILLILLPFRQLYLLLALLLLMVAVLIWLSHRLPVASTPVLETRRPGLYRHPALLLLGFITGLGMLAEGAMEAWSAIYLRSYLELPTLLGAAGVAVFHGAMFAGRILAAPVVARVSRRRLLAASGALAAAGMTLALARETPALILTGLLLVGLGLAIVVPVGFSLAGDLAPGRVGEATSVIA
ncbi:MAG: MFS transporter, partial [Candidatus Competibacteraceae bacterium]|nr:MFS transporter [Candidatus Competibacteraceae bacterium]